MPSLRLVTNYRPDRQYSMLRYGDMLRSAIEARTNIRIEEWAPPEIFGHLPTKFPAGMLKQVRNFDKYVLAMAAAPRSRTDFVLFADHSNTVYANHLRGRVLIGVCHDLIPHLVLDGAIEGTRPSRTGEILAKAIINGLRRMDVVLCVSEATREDVVRLTQIDPQRTRVIHNPASTSFGLPEDAASAAATARRRLGLPTGAKLAIHVGGEKWYKNRPAVVRVFAEAAKRVRGEAHLLMIGPDTLGLRTQAAALGVATRLTIRSDLDDAALQSAYHAGGVLIFPSRYEGFGWPVLEAQASGCPVVCSDAASLPEVAGAGASVLPLGDESAMADAIFKLWTNSELADTQVRRGLENVAKFQWPAFENAIAGLLSDFA